MFLILAFLCALTGDWVWATFWLLMHWCFSD